MRSTWILWSAFLCVAFGAVAEDVIERPAESRNEREMLAYPGPWEFALGRDAAILVRDEQLELLSNPDQPVDLSATGEPNVRTWRGMCENAQRNGTKTILIAFDHFFAQYAKGQGDKPRALTPDRPEYIALVAKLSAFAKDYDVGLELSVLSPLEIGPGYRADTGESGVWMHYRKGVRDTKTGAFDVQLWRQRAWSNNKGAVKLEDAGVRVFAFKSSPVSGGAYQYVDPAKIVELINPQVTIMEGALRRSGEYEAVRVRVHGEGQAELGDLDSVFVVQHYRTPEMDYFSESAWPYLKGLVDRYVDAGVRLNGLYADEMHIQQDWNYGSHLDNGEFALRYVSPGLAAQFAAQHGAQYKDLARWMVYFVHGQEDTSIRMDAKRDVQYVWATDPVGARQAALLRNQYNDFLQEGVVDLFTRAKHYAEQRSGHRLQARAHATWAQSPTIDTWEHSPGNDNTRKYEYTSDFIRSNTVQQAAAACADYFKWGDFLTGNGTDHPEGGWLDRDYYGLALAASIGVLNEVPYAYCAHWGMPDAVSRRRQHVLDAYGGGWTPTSPHVTVQEAQHRDIEVLMLYPSQLTAVDERFGSWMAQYGYANYITSAKLLERGQVRDGALEVAGRRYNTLVALFEPFPRAGLLDLMAQFADQGGRVVWSGPPPVIAADGAPVLGTWTSLFGVDYSPDTDLGERRPGNTVRFEGALAAVPPQSILSGFTIDRVFPVAPLAGAASVARVHGESVGTLRHTPSGGALAFLGFRPRDDQSESLGEDVRTWFEVLRALGAYPATGDTQNPTVIARTSETFATRFPNGTIGLAPHLRRFEEGWGSGFVRKPEEDAKALEGRTLPDETLVLDQLAVAGHSITYTGIGALSVRPGTHGGLLAFAGQSCTGITLDGVAYRFAEQPLAALCFAPVADARRVPGGAVFQLRVEGTGRVQIPVSSVGAAVKAVLEGPTLGAKGAELPCTLDAGVLSIEILPEHAGRWIYLLPNG